MAIAAREIQDQLIRYLSDSHLRTADCALLEAEEAIRARRFSRFLARRYYRDRLSRGFRYVRQLLPEFTIAEIASSSEFDSILEHCALGSRSTACAVAQMAVAQLRHGRQESWWNPLLEYERAFFLQLATSEFLHAAAFPQKQLSSELLTFPIPIAELLSRIKRGRAVEPLPTGESTLLFSRTQHGRIYAAELDASTASVYKLVNGSNTAEQIAAACKMSEPEVRRVLHSLVEIGSILLPQHS